MSLDLISTFAFLALVFALSVTYYVKVLFQGRRRFDRVEQQGGSPLLSKSLMEMTYWGLQPLAELFVHFKISANVISFLSLIFGAIAGWALAYGHFGSAGFFSAFSALFDALDGMVARKTATASNRGEVLDASIDRYVEFFFFAGLIVYFQNTSGLQLLTLSALIGSFMVSYSTAKAEALQVTPPRGSMRRPERAMYLTLGAILSPFSSSAYPMIFVLVMVALIANGSALRRLYAISKLV